MINKKKLNRPVIFFVTSILLVVFAVVILLLGTLAWFAGERQPRLEGITAQAVDTHSFSFAIVGSNSREAVMLCGDSLNFEVRAISSGSELYVTIAIQELSSAAFDEFFGSREDLLYGGYQKRETLTTSDTSPETEYVFYDYDLDEYLKGLQPPPVDPEDPVELAALRAERTVQKAAFLKKFLKPENTVREALTFTVTAINGVSANVALVRHPVSADAFYSAGELLIRTGDTLIIRMDYAPEELTWYPEITIPEGDALYAPGVYRAKDLNCFIGQKLNVAFDSSLG